MYFIPLNFYRYEIILIEDLNALQIFHFIIDNLVIVHILIPSDFSFESSFPLNVFIYYM
jgi:hypothetical protein